MVDESGGDFPFDISFNAPASLLSDSTAPNLEAPLTGKMKDLFRFPQDCKKIKESMDTIEKRKAAASPKSPGSRSAHPPGPVSNKASDSGADALDDGEDESLSGERESLSGERESLSGERGSLSGERESLSGERGGLSGERESLSGERESLSGERESLTGEREFPKQVVKDILPSKRVKWSEALSEPSSRTWANNALDQSDVASEVDEANDVDVSNGASELNDDSSTDLADMNGVMRSGAETSSVTSDEFGASTTGSLREMLVRDMAVPSSPLKPQQQQRPPPGILRPPPKQPLPRVNSPNINVPRPRAAPNPQTPRQNQSSFPSFATTTTTTSTFSDVSTEKRRNAASAVDPQANSAIDADSDVSQYHLLQPVATAFDQMAAGMKPMMNLENSLDDIIRHLDELEAKCDAKIEDLMAKRQAFLDATQMMQKTFQ